VTEQLLHPLVFLLASPLLLGVMVKVKAFFAGRRGAPLLQQYFDIWRLLRKEMVLSRTSSSRDPPPGWFLPSWPVCSFP
jgi:formate hydrogenlyase subunit 4